MSPSTTTRKRTHLKSSQVSILQESFNTNPLPDATVRSRLARDLEVTERTIQIWFQNRRAKARKSDTTYTPPVWPEPPTPPRYQATFRTMMTPEIFQELKQDPPVLKKRPRSSSKPEPKSHLLLDPLSAHTRAVSEGLVRDTIAPTNDISLDTTPDYHSLQLIQFPVNILRIGSWTRFTQPSQSGEWDLVCYADPVDAEFVWKVQAEGHYFRIQVPFQHIRQITLSPVWMETDMLGQLEIDISGLPLTFSMWRTNQDSQWVRCGDFTEDKQASLDPVHLLQGSHEALKGCLLDLIALCPDLATKISVVPSVQPPLSPNIDISRDYTLSPTATPEPHYMYSTMPYQQQQPQQPHNKYSSNQLIPPSNYFYPAVNQELYQQLILQQQQQQQHQYRDMLNSYTNDNNTSLLI